MSQLQLTLDNISIETIQTQNAACDKLKDELDNVRQQKLEMVARKNAATGTERKRLTGELTELLESIETLEGMCQQAENNFDKLVHDYGEQELLKAVNGSQRSAFGA